MKSNELLEQLRLLVNDRNSPGEKGDRAREVFADRYSLQASVLQGCFGVTIEDVVHYAEVHGYDGMYQYWGQEMAKERDIDLGQLLEERDVQGHMIGSAIECGDKERLRECIDRYELLLLDILEYCDARYEPFEILE